MKTRSLVVVVFLGDGGAIILKTHRKIDVPPTKKEKNSNSKRKQIVAMTLHVFYKYSIDTVLGFNFNATDN